MKTAVLVSTLTILAAASPAAAQFKTVQAPPDTWVTGWVGGYLNPGRVADGASGTWDFGSSFAGGLGLHRQIGQGLALGIEGSFSPTRYELLDEQGAKIGDGSGNLLTGMISGRLRTGGGEGLGMYVTGGAGALVYRMPELGRWDPDLALHTGAGIEYQPTAGRAIFVEWGRFWTFHQKEGVSDNTAKHSQIRAGVRLGL